MSLAPSPHDVRSAFERELISPHLWRTRIVVIGMASIAGLVVVGFTWLAESAFEQFKGIAALAWWVPLIWTPLLCAAIVWATRRFVRGAGGYGIPQVMAALDPASAHSLLVAGGAAGIAATFNTLLAGIMFAIEELSRAPEQRNSGLIVAAIVLAGLIAVSVHGNGPHFGVIHPGPIGLSLL